MSLAWLLLIGFASLFLLVLLLVLAALFCPVILTVDSETWQIVIRWLGIAEFEQPLPGKKGKGTLFLLGRRVDLRKKSVKPENAQPPAAPGGGAHAPGASPVPEEHKQPRRNLARMARFARRCLLDSEVRSALLRELRILWRGMLDSVALTRRQIRVSLPDPATTGMLMGWLPQVNRALGTQFSANFSGDNSFSLEVRFYPHRAARAFLQVLIRLPYRALLREWQASAA